MPDFTPTAEQLAITEFARNETANLCVEARAGAAKTSTLILIAEALPKTEILCLAFNKKIAEEMSSRLPDNCESKTLHALGFSAWREFVGYKNRLKVSGGKMYGVLKDLVEGLEDAEEKAMAYEAFSDILKNISAAKNEGYLPSRYKGHWKSLVSDEDFYLSLPMEPYPFERDLIDAALIKSFKLALTTEVDFDDMIYCPALCKVSWPRFPLTLIDEAQDLSPINHHILGKLVRNNRIIGVGDPCQAIYGFRGAYSDSLERLAKKFDMQTLYLTISFRCARRVTEEAKWLAPDMSSPDWAVEGEVVHAESWGPSDISEGDAIICRNNAPLFSMAIRMIESDHLPELAGRDLAKPLKKIMNKLGKHLTLQAAAIDALDAWEKTQLKRARDGAKSGIRDQAHCIRIILKKTKTLGDAVAYLDHLLQRTGRVHLMTGHKSKGLEFDRVWFLDPDLCRIDRDQDANVKYVIQTRAKQRLAYVSSENYEIPLTDEEAA